MGGILMGKIIHCFMMITRLSAGFAKTKEYSFNENIEWDFDCPEVSRTAVQVMKLVKSPCRSSLLLICQAHPRVSDPRKATLQKHHAVFPDVSDFLMTE
jgi:hypothetical protein